MTLIDDINQGTDSVQIEHLAIDPPYVTVRLDSMANRTEAERITPRIRQAYPDFTIRFWARGMKIHEARPDDFEDDLEVLLRVNSTRMP